MEKKTQIPEDWSLNDLTHFINCLITSVHIECYSSVYSHPIDVHSSLKISKSL